MRRKFLIAIQFWAGDMKPALRLADFLAKLEPTHSQLADLLLVHRFDCPLDERVCAPLARKFNVFHYRSPRRGVGWPHGCNELWFATMEWVQSMIETRKVHNYKSVFTCEADGAPVMQNWIERLSNAWDALPEEVEHPVYVAGALTDPGPHINGNCMVSTDPKFLYWITRRLAGCPVSVGWDYLYRDEFKKWGWANIPGIRSYYNTQWFAPTAYEQMRKEELIWVHGDKSGCLIDYGLKTFFNHES